MNSNYAWLGGEGFKSKAPRRQMYRQRIFFAPFRMLSEHFQIERKGALLFVLPGAGDYFGGVAGVAAAVPELEGARDVALGGGELRG